MTIKLLKDARVWRKAGEVFDASPAEASFLVSVGSAVVVAESSAVKVSEDLAEVPETATKKRGRKKA